MAAGMKAARERLVSRPGASGSRQFLRDLSGVVVLAVLSLGAGMAINRFAARPLPLVYRSPEQRLEAELTRLVNAKPLRLGELDTVGLEEFRSLVDNKAALILDARASAFYQQGHVPGALNLSRDDFAKDYERLAPTLDGAKEKAIVVYCSGGACRDSRLVASALIALGFSRVRVFAGGWEAWTAAGLPAAGSAR
jgi:rhodanese-related sulfurtransferase